MFRAKLKPSNSYSWEHLVVLQNKFHMCHVCHPVNEEHAIGTVLQKVPFQINPPSWNHLSLFRAAKQELTTHLYFRVFALDLQIFQNEGKFDSIPVCTWEDSGCFAFLEKCPEYQLWGGDHLETRKTPCFSYWHHFQWSVLPSPSPPLPSPSSFPLCLCFHVPAPFLSSA